MSRRKAVLTVGLIVGGGLLLNWLIQRVPDSSGAPRARNENHARITVIDGTGKPRLVDMPYLNAIRFPELAGVDKSREVETLPVQAKRVLPLLSPNLTVSKGAARVIELTESGKARIELGETQGKQALLIRLGLNRESGSLKMTLMGGQNRIAQDLSPNNQSQWRFIAVEIGPLELPIEQALALELEGKPAAKVVVDTLAWGVPR